MYLLDTNVIIWALTSPEKLGERTTNILKNDTIYISAVSVWEMVAKIRKGKLQIPGSPEDIMGIFGANELAISCDHVIGLKEIILPHEDPFDHLLASQARHEGLRFITSDKTLLNSLDNSIDSTK